MQKDNKVVAGKPYGAEFASAVEDKVIEVTYVFPRPGEDRRTVEKVGLVTSGGLHMRRRILQIDRSFAIHFLPAIGAFREMPGDVE